MPLKGMKRLTQVQRSLSVVVYRNQQFPGVVASEFFLALLQKHRHDSGVALETGLVQRRGAVVGDALGVGPFVEQNLGDVEVVVGGGEVEGSTFLDIFWLKKGKSIELISHSLRILTRDCSGDRLNR